MRVLAIETSSSRGSVALADEGRSIVGLSHEEPQAHAERLLPLIEQALAEAGYAKSSIERVAVGIGPGSFTGLRVGIALAEGLALGLGVPVIGVGSLRAMARAVPAADTRLRVPILDARRGEVFAAAYSADGSERLSPCALPYERARTELDTLGSDRVFVGAFAASLGADLERLEGRDFDLPDARWVALLGGELSPDSHPPDPIYVRGIGATLPKLPPAPLVLTEPGWTATNPLK